MLVGTLVAESLRPETALDARSMGLRAVKRYAPDLTANYQPNTWTSLEFEVDEVDAVALADRLAEVLDRPGWYVYIGSAEQAIVVYPGRVFRFQRDDAEARAQAQDYGRRLGVPGYQLDWP